MPGQPVQHQRGAGARGPGAGSELTPRQLAAIARAASSVADAGSLSVTLTALADAVRSAAAVAAAQVVTVHGDGQLTIVGMAGFAAAMEDFTARLAECRRRGAELVMTRVLETRRPAVVIGRRPVVTSDPRWAPIHRLLESAEWDSFACVPMIVRDRVRGVLTAYYPPGKDPTATDMDFLAAMADQAAMAVDYAALLATSQEEARRRERERLARDLHDSVVQHVFSLRLHARALATHSASAADGRPLDGGQVGRTAEEMFALATTALADLRELIFALRPADLVEHGLVDALRVHARAVEARSGLPVRIECPQELTELAPEVEEDLYRIVQEALHNVVKHAGASAAHIRVSAGEDVVVEVDDDGRGLLAAEGDGRCLGMTSMAERAERWGGSTAVSRRPGGGTRVRVSIPREGAR